MRDTEVRIECGTSNGAARIRLFDSPSGETLASVEIDAADFLRLIGGSIQTHPAKQTDHPERIGLRMENERWRVPDAAVSRTSGDGWEDECIAWAMSQPDAVNWETFRASRHNFGLAVTVRRWVS